MNAIAPKTTSPVTRAGANTEVCETASTLYYHPDVGLFARLCRADKIALQTSGKCIRGEYL